MRDYPPSVLEAWATWETLRQLGFSADDIYWVVAMTANAVPRPGLALNVRLKTQGKEMLVTCSGRLEDRTAAELLLEQGREFSALINERAFDEATMRAVLHDSFVWKNKIQFLSVLKHKGFKIPKAQSTFEVST
jgi:hypothetical protein